jgi:hypothetical protein
MVNIKATIQKACELEKLKGVGIILDAMKFNNQAVNQARAGLVSVDEIDPSIAWDLLECIERIDLLVSDAKARVQQRTIEVCRGSDESNPS